MPIVIVVIKIKINSNNDDDDNNNNNNNNDNNNNNNNNNIIMFLLFQINVFLPIEPGFTWDITIVNVSDITIYVNIIIILLLFLLSNLILVEAQFANGRSICILLIFCLKIRFLNMWIYKLGDL